MFAPPTIETERVHLRPIRDTDVDDRVGVILPQRTASQAVARRLGFTLREERVLVFFPFEPHGPWYKPRP